MAAPECDRFGTDLSAYLDGELADARVREVEQHMLGCDVCRRTFERLREVADRLAELPHARAPDELTAAMRRAAERRVLLDTPAPPPPRRRVVWRLYARLGASAALIAACMFAGWYAYDQLQQHGTPSAGSPVATPEDDTNLHEQLVKARRGPVSKRAEPVLARVGKRTAKQTEAPPEQSAADAGGKILAALAAEVRGGAGGGVFAQAEPAGPRIDVFVAPQTPEQLAVMRASLAAWQSDGLVKPESDEATGLAAYGVPPGTRAAAGKTAHGYEFTLQITPTQATDLIDQLERQAPQRVFVRWADVQRVQQGAAAADTASPARSARRPLLVAESERDRKRPPPEQSAGRRRSGGAAVAQGPTRKPAPARPMDELGRARGRAAARGALAEESREERADAEQPRRAPADRIQPRAALRLAPPEAAAKRAAGGRGAARPGARGQEARPPATEPGIRPDASAAPPAADNPIARVQRRSVQLAQQLARFWRDLYAQPETPAERPPRAARAVTLRVRLLPPQTQATRPASSGSGAP